MQPCTSKASPRMNTHTHTHPAKENKGKNILYFYSDRNYLGADPTILFSRAPESYSPFGKLAKVRAVPGTEPHGEGPWPHRSVF